MRRGVQHCGRRDDDVPADDSPSTGRSSGPADTVAGPARPPRFLDEATVKIGAALGGRIDQAIRGRHRRRLRRAGWEHALDATEIAFRPAPALREGNSIEVLIDGSEALPRMAADMAPPPRTST